MTPRFLTGVTAPFLSICNTTQLGNATEEAEILLQQVVATLGAGHVPQSTMTLLTQSCQQCDVSIWGETEKVERVIMPLVNTFCYTRDNPVVFWLYLSDTLLLLCLSYALVVCYCSIQALGRPEICGTVICGTRKANECKVRVGSFFFFSHSLAGHGST